MKRRKISGFIIVFLGASLLWFISKYKNIYEDYVQLEVEWQNVPSGIKLTDNDTPIYFNAKLRDRGFALLFNKIGDNKVIVNYKTATFTQKDSVFFNPQLNLSDLQESNTSLNILSVTNKDFYIPTITYDQKKVGLKRDFDLRFKKNFQLIEEIGMIPDSIIIYGDKNILKQIDQLKVSSEPLNINDTLVKVNYNVNLPKGITESSLQTVSYVLRAARMTEGEFLVPVQVVNVPEGVFIKIIPDNVHVTFNTTVDNFEKVDAEDFMVSIDYNSIEDHTTTAIPSINVMSDGILQPRLKEESVQILVVK